jgi:GntR family carbon starvation induced transcriptional regulator
MLENFSQSNPATASPRSKTLVESAYARLRQDIIEGGLAPGSRLRVEHLKDSYGVGAGTLREALALLVSDALVVCHSQRGFHVTPISICDFHDITQTRIMLETEALRQSIRDGDDIWESRLIAAFHLLSRAEERLARSPAEAFGEWEERNREFHQALISACASRWTHYFLGLLYRQAERYRRLVITRQPIPRDLHNEHQIIFDATLQRDADRAATILSQHIAMTYDAVKQLPPELFNSSGRSKSSPVE